MENEVSGCWPIGKGGCRAGVNALARGNSVAREMPV
jgi:hypothetical protein